MVRVVSEDPASAFSNTNIYVAQLAASKALLVGADGLQVPPGFDDERMATNWAKFDARRETRLLRSDRVQETPVAAVSVGTALWQVARKPLR
jgi:hypothetical protein